MPRMARIVAKGMPHHITQRGNMREDVFFCEQDYPLYKLLLERYAKQHGMKVWAYCLMTNHIHLVAVPHREDALAKTLKQTHQTYALAVNRRLNRTGHMWQGRFYSCVLDEAHLWAAVRYVENNPVRVGMVERAEDYAYSSAPAHCGLVNDSLLSPGFPPDGDLTGWSQWLRHEEPEQVHALRAGTRTGRPCGDRTFLKRLESMFGRSITKRKPGPKKKVEEGDS